MEYDHARALASDLEELYSKYQALLPQCQGLVLQPKSNAKIRRLCIGTPLLGTRPAAGQEGVFYSLVGKAFWANRFSRTGMSSCRRQAKDTVSGLFDREEDVDWDDVDGKGDCWSEGWDREDGCSGVADKDKRTEGM